MSGYWFDGVTLPRLHVGIHVSGSLQRAADAFVLDGTGLLDGTFRLTDGSWVDVTDDARSIEIERGRDSSVDAAQPGRCTIKLEDENETYNWMKPGAAYPKNILPETASGFEDGTVAGWTPGNFFGDTCTIASSTAQAHSGTHSLALTAIRDGDMFAVGPSVAVQPGQRVQVSAWFRAAAVGSSQCKAVVQWYDAGNVFIQEDTFFGPPSITTGWVQATVDASPPDFAAYARPKANIDAVLTGNVHYVDDVHIDVSQIDVGLPVRIQAEWNGVVYSRFFGSVTDLEYDLGYTPIITLNCRDGLEILGRADMPLGIVQSADGYSGDQIRSIANIALWPTSLESIDKGSSRIGRILTSDSALSLIQQIEKTEGGLVYVDGEGRLVFWDRHRIATDTRTTTVQATFDNSVELGELLPTRSTERIYNDWHLVRAATSDDDVPVEQVAQDGISIARYGVLSGPSGFGVLAYGDEETLALAQFLKERYKDSGTLVRSLSIEASALGLWDTLLPLGVLDRINISNAWGFANVHLDLLIQKMHEEITVDNVTPTWNFTFTTEPTVLRTIFFPLDGTAQLNGTKTLGW